jgi:hypothetical protein
MARYDAIFGGILEGLRSLGFGPFLGIADMVYKVVRGAIWPNA